MAKLGKSSPSRSYPDLNMAMMASPILPSRSRDPRIKDPWNVQERNTSKLAPFPETYSYQKAISAAPYPHFVGTPDTGETMSPFTTHTNLRPAKLSFSPHPTHSEPKIPERSSYCLMYSTHHALQNKALHIEDIQTIFASPILQEQLHYLLMDHALDETKISETLKYLGVPKCLFLQYINRVYPQHFYTIHSNFNGAAQ